MILWLTTVHENDAVIPLLAKEGPGAVDCSPATPSVPSLRGGREASQVASQNGEFWTKDGSLQDGGSLTVLSSKAVGDLCSNLVASFQIDAWHDYSRHLRHADVEIQVVF